MTYVPSLNLGQTLSMVDGRTGEGIWAKDVPAHVSESGEIVPDAPPFLPLRNGAFEEGPATGAPLGWRVVGTGGKNGSWSMDATQSVGCVRLYFSLELSNSSYGLGHSACPGSGEYGCRKACRRHPSFVDLCRSFSS